jgi:hypothetical protein
MLIQSIVRSSHQILMVLCPTLVLLATASPIFAQTPRPNPAPSAQARPRESTWWTLGERTVPEKGKFDELQARKKVFVEIAITNSDISSSTERNEIQKEVNEALSSHKGLQLVGSGALAEFAVIVRASTAGKSEERPNFNLNLDPDAEVSIDVTVVVPGSKQADGSTRPRVVWEASSPNTQTEAASAARFTVDGFLWELKKLKDPPKK